MDEGLLRRLFDIETRLRSIEGRLGTPGGLPPGSPPTSTAPTPELKPTLAPTLAPAPTPVVPPPLPPVAAFPLEALLRDGPVVDGPEAPRPLAAAEAALAGDRYPANLRAAHDGDRPPAASIPKPDFPPAVPAPKPFPRSPMRPLGVTGRRGRFGSNRTAPPPDRAGLERTIGLKWAGWVGAIVLVIGTALGIKFAYDQGWFGSVPDAARCGLIAAGGLLLVGLGEAVFRRVDKLAASGLYGAGVAVLFLAAYAGQAWYELFGPGVAVILMAGAAAAGLAVAARADLVSVAALTVLGAGITPACFDTPASPEVGFLLYLLFIQAMAVGLCFWRATPKWWALRGLSLAVTTVWLVALPVRTPVPWPDWAQIAAVLLSAAAYQGELIVTAARAGPGTRLGRTGGAAFSLLTTAALTLELLETFDGRPPREVGAMLIGLAVAAFLVGTFLRRPALRPLARGFDVQAVALLALAVPVMLDGPAVPVGWMLLSAALAVLSAKSHDRLAATGAVAVWLLGVAGTYAWADRTVQAVWRQPGGQTITAGVMPVVVLGAALAAVAHLTAFAIRRAAAVPVRVRPALDAVSPMDFAGVAAFAGLLALYAPADLFTRTAVAYGLALWAASFAPGMAAVGAVGTAVLSLTAAKWAGVDVLVPRLSPGWTPAGPAFLNARTATGLTLAAAMAVTGRVDRGRGVDAGESSADAPAAVRADMAWAVAFTIAVAVFGFAIGVDVDHAVVARHAAGEWTAWPGFAAQSLLLTLVVAACVGVWAAVLRRTLTTVTVRRDVLTCARGAAYLLAAKFAFVDVIGPALAGRPATVAVVFNLQAAVAIAVGTLLVFTGRPTDDAVASPATGLAVIALLLVTGSAEIDRYAVRQTAGPAWIVRQVGWSVYWAALAVATLLTGFALRRRPLRLAALGLLAATLLKVTIVDLTGVGTGWRILSFLGLGALLLLTSVLYGRFQGSDRGEHDVAAADL